MRPFPSEAALVNHFSGKAYLIRRMGAFRPMSQETVVAADARSEKGTLRRRVLDFKVECRSTEAVLLAAPFVGVSGATSRGFAAQLRLARLSVWVDDEPVMERAPVGLCPSSPDSGLPEGVPFLINREPRLSLFTAERLNPRTMEADGDVIGLFLVNQAQVRAEMTGIPTLVGGSARVEVGGVAALYGGGEEVGRSGRPK